MPKDKEPKRRDRLAREGEPSQRTEEGLEIPIPDRGELLNALGKVVRKRPSEPPPRGKRRSSRGQ